MNEKTGRWTSHWKGDRGGIRLTVAVNKFAPRDEAEAAVVAPDVEALNSGRIMRINGKIEVVY
jgi:hypothetical protein